MFKTVLLASILAATLALAACNTMAGAGEDLSNGGKDLTNSADRNK